MKLCYTYKVEEDTTLGEFTSGEGTADPPPFTDGVGVDPPLTTSFSENQDTLILPAGPLIKKVKIGWTDFLNVSHPDIQGGSTNADLIVRKYKNNEMFNKITLAPLDESMPILKGTTLIIPIENVGLDQEQIQEMQPQKAPDKPYFGGYSKTLKDYSKLFKFDNNDDLIKNVPVGIFVIIWIRSIDKIINITPFITNCSVSSNKQGSSFSFSLNPIADLDDMNVLLGGDVVNHFSVNGEKSLNVDFFEKNIQQNDTVFIKFAGLDYDPTNNLVMSIMNSTNHIVDSSQLMNFEIWDFIGLVDVCNITYSAASTDKGISVSGRDFMKLLTDDGSYFIAYKYVEGKDDEHKMVWGGDPDSKWGRRNLLDGRFDTFFSLQMKTIEDSIMFIINRLSNLGMAVNLWPEVTNILTSYEDTTTKVVDQGIMTCPEDPKDEIVGIWNAVRVSIDPNVKHRILVGEGLTNPDGALIDFFNSVCQSPFVEFYGDCYTNVFDITVRKPPYSRKCIEQVWEGGLYFEIEEKDLLGFSLQFDTTSYSSYQIEPQNQIAGIKEGDFAAIVPVIFLPIYAETFGNKRLQMKDIYLDRISVFGTSEEIKFNPFLKGILDDYQFLIESYSYLPFTRKGTININGNRLIKKGTFVLNKATNELFYVDSVSNDYYSSGGRLDRTTTLNVSRGMKTSHILSGKQMVEGKFRNIPCSYFDIVDAEVIKKNIMGKIEDGGKNLSSDFKTNFGVDETIFKYFLKRNQF
jgi:hypothetical protein